jgi:hypothetical protein
MATVFRWPADSARTAAGSDRAQDVVDRQGTDGHDVRTQTYEPRFHVVRLRFRRLRREPWRASPHRNTGAKDRVLKIVLKIVRVRPAAIHVKGADKTMITEFPLVFHNHGVRLAGRLFRNTERVEVRQPGVIVTGSWLTVKEQMPKLYAIHLAERGAGRRRRRCELDRGVTSGGRSSGNALITC